MELTKERILKEFGIKTSKNTKETILMKEPVKENDTFIQHNDVTTTVEELQCLVCHENRKCILYMPCMHMSMCFTCSNLYFEGQKTREYVECLVCRKMATHKVMVFY